MMYWNILTSVDVKKDDGVIVELSWGWTAGMTEKELENYAEDAPRGHESVVTTLDMAKDLRDRLTKIIDEHEEEHNEIRKRVEEKINERFGDVVEQLMNVDHNNGVGSVKIVGESSKPKAQLIDDSGEVIREHDIGDVAESG